MMWLKVVKSNNNPVVPAALYIEVVRGLNKCPKLLQTDCGTENGLMASIQCALRKDIEAHRYGKSVANQRIENWWSHFRRGYTNWVIDFFKELVTDGLFILGNNVYMKCAWFVFSSLLQSDLDEVRIHWNSHYIRKSHDHVIGGIPDKMFFLPETSGAVDIGTTHHSERN